VDERVACLKGGDLALVVVNTDDGMTHFGKADGSDQANVSGPHNGDFDVFTHSALVLFLIVEDNRTQEQSRRFGDNPTLFCNRRASVFI
jgi:hypothetical protein